MFYVWFWVSFDTQYILCVVSRCCLIPDKFYVTFQGCCLGVFMVIVYKALVSLISVFKALLFSGLRGGQTSTDRVFSILGWKVTSSVRFKNPDQMYLMWFTGMRLTTGIWLIHSNQWKIKSTFYYLNQQERYYFENLATSTLRYRQPENMVFISW